ncbi:Ppx/GppA phosphatase family protein [Belliella pelovolcani]|uniref:Exopolyphosphatase / guanosine-5'-triphosphate,3'-diphosphate pyrophosphatase n=1 Tax=Belliella pelovolcani TaxID=529505 RepID=A0A1N7NRX5_9BACT|nr:phosphatase [Belliella pelovolcani]SIT01123.1 exopolyphosphatase / guanosine-5'-triphosphate,3'-diphosphate pyrophosphatase [Belliella pelovolcani]
MKLAAVDIGSNAIRLQITNVTHYEDKTTFKKLEYLRFPLRLGMDVFHVQKISDKNRRKFVKLMKAFKLLIDLYEVDDYMVCATSAMRESANGKEIADEVKQDIGLKIQIIDGNREAELINLALWSYIDEKPYLHIDVGGGSTELNIYKNKQKIASKSFKIGSVRALDDNIPLSVWKSMNKFIEENITNKDKITCIGTGGNINKIFELSNPAKNKRYISPEKIKEIKEYLESFSYEDRINKLNLNPDRADVIIPASKIYLAAMTAAASKKMIVPDVGLKDGLMNVLYERNKIKKVVK